MKSSHRNTLLMVALCGAVLSCLCAGIASLGDLKLCIPAFTALYLAAFVPYVAALFLSRRRSAQEEKGSRLGRTHLSVILFVAVVCRVLLLFTPPSLSDDIYRYVWEGGVVNAGANPFGSAPDASELAGLRDEIYEGVNHKWIPSIYPPLAQALFALSERVKRSLTSMKVAMVIIDLLVIGVLLRMLRRRGLASQGVLAYAWNPLVLVEVSGSGHLEPLPVLFLLLALDALDAGRKARAAAALALSFLGKLFAVALLPIFARRVKPAWIVLAVAIVLAGYFPFLDAGKGLWSGAFEYGRNWRFNDSLFALASMIAGSPGQARAIVIIAFAAIVIWRTASREDTLKSAFWLTGAFVLLTPTAHPWYLLWVAPFLCFWPRASWIVLCASIVLSYGVLIEYSAVGVWREPAWTRPVAYIPFYALLLWEWAAGRRAGARVSINVTNP